ncbi:hypothetical protein BS50DRAFT_644514 [Corynespora cassiicola Philippines]|uniref:Peptidase M12A domain-containing protein n=1 Tax=Corynespora cassiicola Philippines TaxID=1448308 RepID=A0A2T2PD70_CORCC|nr:hypothetical protein BS50DRAFT_644514 [Corynespora cassiicola Philippines]
MELRLILWYILTILTTLILSENLTSPNPLFRRSLHMFNPGIEGAPNPWPRNPQNNLVEITYCYLNQRSRDEARSNLEDAIKGWIDALGGPASHVTGHGLAFRDVKDDEGNPIFCSEDGGSGGSNWNSEIPLGTMNVEYRRDVTGEASMWYRLDSSNPWRNHLKIGASADVVSTMHELGHKFGMGHEHQRADRDQFVRFRCHNLIGFEEATEDAQENDRGMNWQIMCEDPRYSTIWGFTAIAQYSLNFIPDASFQVLPLHTDDTPYDILSIMHYPTGIHSYDACLTDWELDQCDMVKWKTPKEAGVEWIARNMKPSAGDLAFVRRHYPWLDPPSSGTS